MKKDTITNLKNKRSSRKKSTMQKSTKTLQAVQRRWFETTLLKGEQFYMLRKDMKNIVQVKVNNKTIPIKIIKIHQDRYLDIGTEPTKYGVLTIFVDYPKESDN